MSKPIKRRLLRPHDPSGRPRLLMVAPDHRFRLEAIDRLRDKFEVITPPEHSDPGRACREHSPEVVLLTLDKEHPGIALAAVQRLLRGLENPPSVGLVDMVGTGMDYQRALEKSGADGWYSGGPIMPNWSDFLGWVDDLYDGRAPVVQRPMRSGGFLRKLLDRFR